MTNVSLNRTLEGDVLYKIISGELFRTECFTVLVKVGDIFKTPDVESREVPELDKMEVFVMVAVVGAITVAPGSCSSELDRRCWLNVCWMSFFFSFFHFLRFILIRLSEHISGPKENANGFPSI